MGNGFADIPAYFQFLRNMVEGRFNVHQPTSSSYLFIAIRLRFFGPLEGSRSHSKASNEGINTRKLCPIRLGARFLRPELRDRLPHRHPPPVRVRPINLMLAPLRLHPAGYIFHRLLNRPLSRIEDAEIVRVSLVRLEHGELRIPSPTE